MGNMVTNLLWVIGFIGALAGGILLARVWGKYKNKLREEITQEILEEQKIDMAEMIKKPDLDSVLNERKRTLIEIRKMKSAWKEYNILNPEQRELKSMFLKSMDKLISKVRG